MILQQFRFGTDVWESGPSDCDSFGPFNYEKTHIKIRASGLQYPDQQRINPNEKLMTNKEINDEALLHSIIDQLRSKGTLCGTGEDIDEIRRVIDDKKRKANEGTKKSMREIWKGIKDNRQKS